MFNILLLRKYSSYGIAIYKMLNCLCQEKNQMFIFTGSGDIQLQAQAPKALNSISFPFFPNIGMRCVRNISSRRYEQSQWIFADMLSSEYSCVGQFLGSLGPGVPALGGLEHETFFEISPCYFR